MTRTFDVLPRLWAVDPAGFAKPGMGSTARSDIGSDLGQAGTASQPLTGRSSRSHADRQDRVGRERSDRSAVEGGEDPEELHTLVVEHGDAIYRLALSVVRDPSLAEDIAQETLVKAWLALPTFRAESSMRSWVLRIAHNTAISTIRRRRAVVMDPNEFPDEPTLPDRSVESRVQSEVVMAEFIDALDLLDDLSRSIVVLRELEGMAYDEIADVLNVPMPTVKTRLLRARRKLGSALREWS
ncbi:MAG: RNA polymerase sigma factor [Actinomycetota bacterium]